MQKEETKSKIESYLIQMNMSYESPNENIWVVHDDINHIDNIVISYEDPIIIFRVKLMNIINIPKSNQKDFFETILRLNCTSMIHGAYAIEEDSIVIIDTLESKNIDLNEFQASLDAINIAITSDYKELSKYLKNKGE